MNQNAVLGNRGDDIRVDEVTDQVLGRRVVDVRRVDAGGVAVLGKLRLLELFVVGTRVVASYDDAHDRAATAVLDRADAFETQSVELDAEFPLDDGENAAVTLANDIDAALLLCDEFTQSA